MNKLSILKKSRLSLFVAATSLALTACSASPPKKQFYTLLSENTASAVPVELEGGLGVGPIELPESFRGDSLISVASDGQVIVSREHSWAGDFKRNISRTIATNLSAQLGSDDVWPYPWDTRHRPQKQVSLLIEQMQGELGASVAMTVKWILFEDSGSQAVSVGREEFTAETPDATYIGYVKAINDLVSQCSERLEVAVREQWVEDKP